MRLKTVWFPHRAYVFVRKTKPQWHGDKPVEIYDRRWFWPGDRVEVSTTIMSDDGGIENLFAPLLLLNIFSQKTKEVIVYRKIEK